MDMRSPRQEIADLLAEQPEPTIAMNPLTGVDLEDMRRALGQTLRQGARQPLVLARHLTRHARKLTEIVAGRAEYTPENRDPRFTDPAWMENGAYRRLLQSYLAAGETLHEWLADLDLDAVGQLRAEFLARIATDSAAPSNTLLTNPEALRAAVQTRGSSLVRGAGNLLHDLRHNHGIPAQVSGENFRLGENIAASEGAVVYTNEVLELIQYRPTTRKVHRRPLLMVSAMINKFYALDLSPERSLIKYCLDKGIQVFVVSWANPRLENADWGLETYASAVIEAIAAIKAITRSKDLNLFSLCSGAMATSPMAAYLKATGDTSINAMTIGVCMLQMQAHDMEIAAFAGPELVERVRERSRRAGILRGHELALSMLWLRPQELIWGNVVNNYLLGRSPPEFDLLYWNNDWTNLPAQLHSDVLDMFFEGALLRPGEMVFLGKKLDLSTLDCDKFFLGGLTDHITPWQACYRSALAFGGDNRFLLSNSGHMQTMLNAPGKRGASYFSSEAMPASPEDWFDGARQQQGSWWISWGKWLLQRSGSVKNAPASLGNRQYPSGAPAPGTYVYQQSE